MRSCPECKRPNGDAHARCMYCGASLPAAEETPTKETPIELANAFRMLDRVHGKPAAPVVGRVPAMVPMDLDEDTQESITTLNDLPAAGIAHTALETLSNSALEALTGDTLSRLAAEPALAPGPSRLSDYLGKGRTCFGLRSEPYRLFLLPPDGLREPRPELRKMLADAMELDLYTAGQYLVRTYPVPLLSGKNQAPLQRLQERLEGTGLVNCLLLPRNELRRRKAPLVADSGRRDGEAWKFSGGGESVSISKATVCATYFAEIRPQTSGPSRPPVPLPAGRDLSRVLRGRQQEAPKPSSVLPPRGPYWVMDIVSSDQERWVRIRADGFDFRVLPETGISALQNLRALSRLLLPVGEELDEGFKRVPVGPLSPADPEDLSEAPEAERRFTEYSLLMGLHRQRLHARE